MDRTTRTKLLPLAALAVTVAALLLSTALGAPSGASADQPHAGLEFSIAVTGVSGCDTTDDRDATCTIQTGASFALEIKLDSIGGIPSYGGYDAILNYEGVTAFESPNTGRWPDCGFPASNFQNPGVVALACAIGLPPAGPSTYTGVLAVTGFTCAQSGTITMLHDGVGNTDLVEDIGIIHAEDGEETLTIECTTGGTVPPTPPGPGDPTDPEKTATAEAGGPTPAGGETPQPTLEPTAAAAATAAAATATAARRGTATAEAGGGEDGGDDDGGGLPVWAWIVIGVGVVGGGGGLGYVGWRYYQQRQATG